MMRKQVLFLSFILVLAGCSQYAKKETLPTSSAVIIPTPTAITKTPYPFPKGDLRFEELLSENIVCVYLCLKSSDSMIETTLLDETATEFISLLRDFEISTDYEIIHGAGGPVSDMIITDAEGMQYYYRDNTNECAITMSVDEESMIYGYWPKNGLLLEAFNEYFKEELIEFRTNFGLFSLPPYLIETEAYRIKGELRGWIPPYESIKDYDFKKDGLTAYENGEEIEVLSDSWGEHHVFFKKDTGIYQLKYFVDKEK